MIYSYICIYTYTRCPSLGTTITRKENLNRKRKRESAVIYQHAQQDLFSTLPQDITHVVLSFLVSDIQTLHALLISSKSTHDCIFSLPSYIAKLVKVPPHTSIFAFVHSKEGLWFAYRPTPLCSFLVSSGNAFFSAIYGCYYERKKDFEKAIRLWKVPAKENDQYSQFKTGVLYYEQSDYGSAKKWLSAAASATVQQNSIDINNDEEETRKRWVSADSAIRLACILADESATACSWEGPSRSNSSSAIKWLKHACSIGDRQQVLDAERILTSLYRTGSF